MFFAVVFLLSSVNVAVGQINDVKKLRSDNFDLKFGNARPLHKLHSLIDIIFERFGLDLSRSSRGVAEDVVEGDSGEDLVPPGEEVPEEEEIPDEGVPDEGTEEEEIPDEGVPEEGEEESEEEEPVGIDLSLDIENVEVDEKLSGNSIFVYFDFKNNCDIEVKVPSVSESSEISIVDSDGKVSKYVDCHVDSPSYIVPISLEDKIEIKK